MWNIYKKAPLKKFCFNNVADSRPETWQKHNITEDFFLQISKIFQNNSSFKSFVGLTLDGVNLFGEKASPKYIQDFAKNMWLK